MNEEVAKQLDEKYSIQRKTHYTVEDLKSLREKITETLRENPTWKEEWVRDSTLQRYLINNAIDVTAAHGYVVKMCKWRCENNVDGITLQHPDVQVEMATNRSEILTTPDRCGRPVVLFRVRNHSKDHGNMERVEKHVIAVFEELVRISEQNADGKFTSVFDLQGFGYQNMDLEVTKKSLGLLYRYYPQRIGSILLINYPFVFYGFWSVVSLLLDGMARSHILWCGENELADFVDITVAPFDKIFEC